ncbi:MAG: TerB family tellurite resistance protein [Cyclobacteriaceae bacterium]
MEIESEKILTGHSSKEKAAYLGALASLATADRHADEEEIEHLGEMASAAGLSEQDSSTVLNAAKDTTGDYLLTCLNTLKTTELRFSLVTDLIALAKTDDNYTQEEKNNIEKVSKYLGVNKDQFSVLDQFVDKASESSAEPEEMAKPGFMESLGMKNQFSGAGMNMGSIGKGLLSILGPMILGGMAAKTLGGGRRGSSGGLGGMMGGNNPMGMGRSRGLGGGLGGLGGGLGSIISGMSRGRNNQSMGGMLGRLLR